MGIFFNGLLLILTAIGCFALLGVLSEFLHVEIEEEEKLLN